MKTENLKKAIELTDINKQKQDANVSIPIINRKFVICPAL
jgi:hypothetical protein